MKRHELLFSVLKVPFDFILIFSSFFIAKALREINDFVPGVQLPIQTIESKFLLNFAIVGSLLYILVFTIHGLYNIKITNSKIKETLDIITYSIYSFLFLSVIIYFGKGIFYKIEIPRLVILFTLIVGIFLVILERIFLNKLQNILLNKGVLEKRKIILINNKSDDEIENILEDIKKANIYEVIGYLNKNKIKDSEIKYLGNDISRIKCNFSFSGNKGELVGIPRLNEIQSGGVFEFVEGNKENEIFEIADEIIYIDSDFSSDELYKIWDYSRIFGIKYRYVTNGFDVTKTNTTISLLNEIPLIEIKNTPLDSWARVIKRLLDFFGSIFGIIIFSPLFILISILIKIEDPSGPAIYKNKRVGQNSKEFNLYKFRYIKWKYCIKDSYGVNPEEDEALKYEQKLIKERTTRQGPLYKIKDDPRKTRTGRFIEKYSLDELPQLFNVFIGNMSLVGPRPHQPREVNNYQIHERRVLTIKPGITGLAQVNGREKNKFEDEVNLDIFYIENRNFLLDIKIILKTFTTIINRK